MRQSKQQLARELIALDIGLAFNTLRKYPLEKLQAMLTTELREREETRAKWAAEDAEAEFERQYKAQEAAKHAEYGHQKPPEAQEALCNRPSGQDAAEALERLYARIDRFATVPTDRELTAGVIEDAREEFIGLPPHNTEGAAIVMPTLAACFAVCIVVATLFLVRMW